MSLKPVIRIQFYLLTEYRNNFLRLQKLVLIGGPDDGVITPWQSAHVGAYNTNETVLPFEKQPVSLWFSSLYCLPPLYFFSRLFASFSPVFLFSRAYPPHSILSLFSHTYLSQSLLSLFSLVLTCLILG